MSGNTSNLDAFTVIRSDNRDVERVQLNKILRRLGERDQAVSAATTAAQAAISAEAITRADADTALAGQISTVTTTVNSTAAALAAAESGLQGQLDGLSAQVGDIMSADEHNSANVYGAGELVKVTGTPSRLYRSRQAVPAGILITNTTYWSFIGNYESLGEATADSLARINVTESRLNNTGGGRTIEVVASDLAATIASINDQNTGLASKASITSLNTVTGRLNNTGGGRTVEQVASTLVAIEGAVNDPATGLASRASVATTNSITNRLNAVGTTGQSVETVAQNAVALKAAVEDPNTGLGSRASNTRMTAAEARLNDTGGGRAIEVVASDLLNLQGTVNNPTTGLAAKAQLTQVNQISADLDTAEGTIAAQGSSITSLNSQVAARAQVHFQAAPPAGSAHAVNDLWFDSDDNNRQYRWSGTAWVLAEDARWTQRNRVFAQAEPPTGSLTAGDLWIDTNDNNRLYRWDGASWVGAEDLRIAANASAVTSLTTRVTTVEGAASSQGNQITVLQNDVADLESGLSATNTSVSNLTSRVTAAEGTLTSQGSSITQLDSQVNSRARVYFQNEAPAGTLHAVNDLWFDSDDNNRQYRWNSTAWVVAEDGRWSQRNRVFAQPAIPGGTLTTGDLWIDTDDGNRMYRWDGANWQPADDARIASTASALSTLTTRVTNAEGVNTSQANSITALESTVNSPTTGVAATSTAVSQLSTRVTDAENDIGANASAITSLNATVAGKASASAVQALEASAGGGGNLLSNTSFATDLAGWGAAWDQAATGAVPVRNLAAPDWQPTGINTIGVQFPGTPPSGQNFIVGPTWIAIEPLKRYGFSAFVAAHRMHAGVYIEFWDEARTTTLATSSSVGPRSRPGGRNLSDWDRPVAYLTAPANARWARVFFWGTFIGEANAHMWMCRPMLEEVPATQTVPSPWSAGGAESFSSWNVTLDVNGRISGLGSFNNGVQSNFWVLADVFRIYDPPSTTPVFEYHEAVPGPGKSLSLRGFTFNRLIRATEAIYAQQGLDATTYVTVRRQTDGAVRHTLEEGHASFSGPATVDGQHIVRAVQNATADSSGNVLIPELTGNARLGAGGGALITDWNAATSSGWYTADGALNAPASGWLLGQVVVHNGQWVTQEVWHFTLGVDATRFRRFRLNGTWTPWVDAARSHIEARLNDTRGFNAPVGNWPQRVVWDFKARSTLGWPGTAGFGAVATISQWENDSGGGDHQLVFAESARLFHRYGTRAGGWGAWRELWTSATLATPILGGDNNAYTESSSPLLRNWNGPNQPIGYCEVVHFPGASAGHALQIGYFGGPEQRYYIRHLNDQTGWATSGTWRWLNHSGAENEDPRGNLRDIPPNTQNGNYTFGLLDRGRHVAKSDAGAWTYTVPAHATVAFPIGTAITVRNRNASGNITIARAAGVVLRRAGSGTDANATIAPWGLATLLHEDLNAWVISGTGVS